MYFLPWTHTATKQSLNLHPDLAQVLLLVCKGTSNAASDLQLGVCLSVVPWNRCEPFEGKAANESCFPRSRAWAWIGAWLEMMLHLHSLGLVVSTLPSEAAVLDAVVPTSMCRVHMTENRGGSMVPTSRLPSCTGFSKKQPQTCASHVLQVLPEVWEGEDSSLGWVLLCGLVVVEPWYLQFKGNSLFASLVCWNSVVGVGSLSSP